MLKLGGVIPPMVTPLDRNGKVDEASTRRLVDFILNAGADGLFLLGTMGEGMALQNSEKTRLVEIVLDEVRGRCPVLAGAGDISFPRALENSFKLQELGVDAVVPMQPSFFRGLSGAEIEGYFVGIAERLDIPVVIYNNPGLAGNTIPLETLARLCSHPKIIGTKDSTGDFAYFVESLLIKARCNKPFSVLQGNEWSIAPSVLCGADGVVPGIGSLAGKLVKRIYEEARLGHPNEAMELQFTLMELFHGIYGSDRSDWLRGHKEALAYLGIISSPTTLPFRPMSEEGKARVRSCVDRLKDYLL
ncbi:MAG: dihydrodipicolinate synthase family protein [Firmicutes bacterium]|nr:dihydrodipicolinate synthase family protein [Bacillota bacterium]